jgi:hypothetical protein
MNVNLSSTKDRHHQARCQKYKHEIGTYVTVGSYDGNVIPAFFFWLPNHVSNAQMTLENEEEQ